MASIPKLLPLSKNKAVVADDLNKVYYVLNGNYENRRTLDDPNTPIVETAGRGLGMPVKFTNFDGRMSTGLIDVANYALTIRNRETTASLGLLVQHHNGTTVFNVAGGKAYAPTSAGSTVSNQVIVNGSTAGGVLSGTYPDPSFYLLTEYFRVYPKMTVLWYGAFSKTLRGNGIYTSNLEVTDAPGWIFCDGGSYTMRDGTPAGQPNMQDKLPLGAGGAVTLGGTAGVAYTSLATINTTHNHTTPAHSHSHDHGTHSHTLSAHTHDTVTHDHTLNSHTHDMNSHTHDMNSHTHNMNAHTHSLNSHTHDMNSHTHTGPSHQHGMDHTHNINVHAHFPGSMAVTLANHFHDPGSHTHNLGSHTHTLGGHTHGAGVYIYSTSSQTGVVREAGSAAGHDLDTSVNLPHGGTDNVARENHTHNFTASGSVTGTSSGSSAASDGPSTNTSGTPSANNTGNPTTNPSMAVSNNTGNSTGGGDQSNRGEPYPPSVGFMTVTDASGTASTLGPSTANTLGPSTTSTLTPSTASTLGPSTASTLGPSTASTLGPSTANTSGSGTLTSGGPSTANTSLTTPTADATTASPTTNNNVTITSIDARPPVVGWYYIMKL